MITIKIGHVTSKHSYTFFEVISINQYKKNAWIYDVIRVGGQGSDCVRKTRIHSNRNRNIFYYRKLKSQSVCFLSKSFVLVFI